jgi:hypothetical protein
MEESNTMSREIFVLSQSIISIFVPLLTESFAARFLERKLQATDQLIIQNLVTIFQAIN